MSGRAGRHCPGRGGPASITPSCLRPRASRASFFRPPPMKLDYTSITLLSTISIPRSHHLLATSPSSCPHFRISPHMLLRSIPDLGTWTSGREPPPLPSPPPPAERHHGHGVQHRRRRQDQRRGHQPPPRGPHPPAHLLPAAPAVPPPTPLSGCRSPSGRSAGEKEGAGSDSRRERAGGGRGANKQPTADTINYAPRTARPGLRRLVDPA